MLKKRENSTLNFYLPCRICFLDEKRKQKSTIRFRKFFGKNQNVNVRPISVLYYMDTYCCLTLSFDSVVYISICMWLVDRPGLSINALIRKYDQLIFRFI